MAKKASKKRKTAADIPVVDESQEECSELIPAGEHVEQQDENGEEGTEECTDLAVIDQANYRDFFSDPEDSESEPELEAEIPEPAHVDVECVAQSEGENILLNDVLTAIWKVNDFASTKKLRGDAYKKTSESDEDAAARTLSEAISRRKELDNVLASITSTTNALKKSIEKASEELDERIYSICFDGKVSTERARKYFNERPLLAEMDR